MASLSNIRIYPPEETSYATGRVLHSASRHPAPIEYRRGAPSPVPWDSVNSVTATEHPTNSGSEDFDEAADIPDIPLRRSSMQRSIKMDQQSMRDGHMQPSVMKQLLERDHEFMAPGGGPINPNSIGPRHEKKRYLHRRTSATPSITKQAVSADADDRETVVRREPSPEPDLHLLPRGRPPSVKNQGAPPIPARSRPSSAASSYPAVPPPLPALQVRGSGEADGLEPLDEEEIEPGSFDLVVPGQDGQFHYSLERRSEQLFSKEHLAVIFKDPRLLLRFTNFLCTCRQASVPLMIYYFDALKAIRAIDYSNAVLDALEPLEGHEFTRKSTRPTVNDMLKEKADAAFQALAQEDLPAFITHIWIQTVSASIKKRITGTLPPQLRDMSEGLAEVFCLTDPSRHDNPIVFASEEFHRTTQYGMNYVIGRNCRFLQGPKTNPFSVRRIREKLEAGKEHYETFLNYRRDGSPFMNLLMCAPLFDSRGKVRYFIGAQVDVSGLAKDCVGLEALQRLVDDELKANGQKIPGEGDDEEEAATQEKRDEFRELSEMFNLPELETVRRHGGTMHRLQHAETEHAEITTSNWHKPRILIQDETSSDGKLSAPEQPTALDLVSGRLTGIYENYLLVRPYPNLRILFASPSLRVPGILQSPLLARIGGSNRVMAELNQAFADGNGVTARIKWISKSDPEGRTRWIHCTPLLGSNGAIGVWMVVIVDDDEEVPVRPRRTAPPVEPAAYGIRRWRKGLPAEEVASANSTLGPLHDEPEMRRLAQEMHDDHHDKDRRRGAPAFDAASYQGDVHLTPPDSPYTLDLGDAA